MSNSPEHAPDPSPIDWQSLPWGGMALLGALLVALFWDIVPSMANVWWTDDGYSHGILIPPLAAYIAWVQRDHILAAPVRPNRLGYALTAFGALIQIAGRLGAEFFLTRISIVILLAGIILTFWGFGRLRRLAFALILLATMVPIPAIVYNKLAAPLQLFASSVSSTALELMGIPVFRDGNVMHLSEISLGVAEACSGLRSISSLTVLALIVGYFILTKVPSRVALFFLAFPIAIAVNVLRITVTALFARENPALAEGFFHSFSGWVVFLVGFGLLYLAGLALARLEPHASESQTD